VRSQLKRILEGGEFNHRSKQSRASLQYLVDETLAGRGDEIKERTIGAKVLDVAPDYDTQQDTRVRPLLGRVREKLAAHYENKGEHDPILIEIPSNGYKLKFSWREGHEPRGPEPPEEHPPKTEEKEQDGLKEADGAGSLVLEIPAHTGELHFSWRSSHQPVSPQQLTQTDDLESPPQFEDPPSGSSTSVPDQWIAKSDPGRKQYRRLLLFAAVAIFSVALFLYLNLGQAETPNETLKIGLALFNPNSPETDSFRRDLKRSLLDNTFGGPPIRVELLDGRLDAAPEDLDKQATDLSHGNVNLVISATVGADGRLVPRVGLVRSFGYPDLADFPEILNGFAFRVPTGSSGAGAETAPVSDLIKILYAFRYATPASWDKFEFILRDM